MEHLLLTSYRRPTLQRTRVFTDDKGHTIIERAQNFKPIIEFNKRLQSMFDPIAHRAAAGRSSTWTKVASVPNVIYWNVLVKQRINRDPKAMRKWLNRRDTRFFRTDDCRTL